MSSTSIHDQGYTPPDFLQKLFPTTSSLGSNQSIPPPPSSLHHFQSSSDLFQPSSLSFSTPALPPPKLSRAHSLEEDRISTKKFHLFFKTMMADIYKEEESLSIWHKFQDSLNNPFQFDRFIEDIRNRSVRRKQAKQSQQIILSDLKAQSAVRPKSLQARKTISMQRKCSSLGKTPKSKSECTRSMKREVNHIRKIMLHGQKFIRAK